ncbi:MAG: Bor family protein [Bdellovibrionales bacterium]
MNAKIVFLTGIFLLMTGCSTVTMNPKGTAKLETNPTYEKSYPFFLFGLIGERDVYVKEACPNHPVKQIQTVDTFLDSFLGLVTIGIYTPRTVKLWCDKGEV